MIGVGSVDILVQSGLKFLLDLCGRSKYISVFESYFLGYKFLMDFV